MKVADLKLELKSPYASNCDWAESTPLTCGGILRNLAQVAPYNTLQGAGYLTHTDEYLKFEVVVSSFCVVTGWNFEIARAYFLQEAEELAVPPKGLARDYYFRACKGEQFDEPNLEPPDWRPADSLPEDYYS